MIVISKTDDYGLTAGKKYKVIQGSAGYFKVKLDNGNIAYRSAYLFDVKDSDAQVGSKNV